MELNGVKIENYTNLWSEIDRINVGSSEYCLMENDTWGDETCALVIKVPSETQFTNLKNGRTVIFISEKSIICETYDRLEDALADEDIICNHCSEINLENCSHTQDE